MNHPGIHESSGLQASRRFKEVLWTHNDAHNPPQVFAVDREGRLIRQYDVPDAENHDWEDIALDEENRLYILDNTSRSDPEDRNFVYIFAEPDPYRDLELSVAPKKISARFPDGEFDCETIFVWKRKLYFVTKPWDGSLPRLYRLESPESGVLEFLGTIPVNAMITGGDISSDGSRIALSSYRALFIFEDLSTPEDLLQSKPLICPLNARQIEAITWIGDRLVLGNEQREIFHLSQSKWKKQRAPFLNSPKEEVPFTASKPSIETSFEDWPVGQWLRVRINNRGRKIGRVAWSEAGLHLGIELPDGTALAPLPEETDRNRQNWFKPGSVYLLVNPDGSRPLVYGKNDRCIRLGQDPNGQITARTHYLKPATVIEQSEVTPQWVQVEKQGRRLLVTLTREGPGMKQLQAENNLGFNLLLIQNDGELLSWVPLTQDFSWDSPSIWGLLELDER